MVDDVRRPPAGAPFAWAVSFVSCALALLAPGPAAAFVRARTKGDLPKELFWKQSCVPVTIYLGDFAEKSHLSVEVITKSVAAAAHAWSPDAVTCADGATHPFFEIVPTLAPPGTEAPAVGDDARNIVVFRTENWTLDGTVTGTPLVAGALAYTHVTARADGHIVDADILVNGTQAWRNFDPGELPTPDQGETLREFDLQAALTHEFGHLLGFSHTCTQPGDVDVPPKDDRGGDVPECTKAPESVIRSVMFFRTAEDDATKRTLSPDDERAVCEVYKPTLDPKACSVDAPYDGCAVSPRRAGRGLGAGLLTALAAAVIGAWARRRARA